MSQRRMLTPSLIALVFAAFFAALWLANRSAGTLPAAVGWFLYAPYEFLMYLRVLCTGECNIRVDLLVLWPLLIGLSLAVPIRYVVRRFRA